MSLGLLNGPAAPDHRVAVISRPAGVRGLVPLAHGHQQVAPGVVLEDHVAVLDRQVEVLVVVDEHAVGVGENALAPGGEIVALPVQDDQRVFAPVEEVHPVLSVGDDGGLSQCPSLGQLLPILDLLVGVLAIADGGHVVASWIVPGGPGEWVVGRSSRLSAGSVYLCMMAYRSRFSGYVFLVLIGRRSSLRRQLQDMPRRPIVQVNVPG